VRHVRRPLVSLLAGVALAAPATAQDMAAGKQLAETRCAACHGADGNPSAPPFPILAGQTQRYLYLQLRDFKEGRRSDPTMDEVIAPLSREDMLDVAGWFASQKPKRPDFKPDDARVARGAKKAEETLCTMCHLGGFAGQNEIPRVAGQHHDYTVKQLRAFKAKQRTNDAGNMTAVAQTISDEDIVDLAHYLASM
jgi:cytochrome c553